MKTLLKTSLFVISLLSELAFAQAKNDTMEPTEIWPDNLTIMCRRMAEALLRLKMYLWMPLEIGDGNMAAKTSAFHTKR